MEHRVPSIPEALLLGPEVCVLVPRCWGYQAAHPQSGLVTDANTCEAAVRKIRDKVVEAARRAALPSLTARIEALGGIEPWAASFSAGVENWLADSASSLNLSD
jgi:hypothetical protein